MTTAAETIINAFLPVAERAVNALERWLDGAEIGIVDDEPEPKKPWVTLEFSRGGDSSKPVTDLQGTSVTDSEPEPDAVTTEGLTVDELEALPEWSVVETWGHDWVKTTIGWVMGGDDDTERAEDLIRIWGPVTLAHRAPGPDELVIKRDERWHPGYLRLEAAELDVCRHRAAAGVVRTVADALEAEQ